MVDSRGLGSASTEKHSVRGICRVIYNVFVRVYGGRALSISRAVETWERLGELAALCQGFRAGFLSAVCVQVYKLGHAGHGTF